GRGGGVDVNVAGDRQRARSGLDGAALERQVGDRGGVVVEVQRGARENANASAGGDVVVAQVHLGGSAAVEDQIAARHGGNVGGLVQEQGTGGDDGVAAIGVGRGAGQHQRAGAEFGQAAA